MDVTRAAKELAARADRKLVSMISPSRRFLTHVLGLFTQFPGDLLKNQARLGVRRRQHERHAAVATAPEFKVERDGAEQGKAGFPAEFLSAAAAEDLD